MIEISNMPVKKLFFTILILVILITSFSICKAEQTPDTSKAEQTCVSLKYEREKLDLFLKEARISKIQQEGFALTNEMAKKYQDHRDITTIVSSDRYGGEFETSLEKILDYGVKNGDLPIQNFSVADVQNAKSKAKPTSDKDVKFFLYPNLDALKMHEEESVEDGSIVNLASQYNALESVSNKPSSVKWWPYDQTQGPYCALQSVVGAKHREAAHLQQKLTDALEDLLKECKINGQSIIQKYPNLYTGGYLEMMEIKDTNDMEVFKSFLAKNVQEMKFLSQWVRCEGTGKKQLQVFTAAPSFQSYSKNIWDKKDKLTELRRECCVILIEAQYKALAQAAAIRSVQTGKNVKLHVSMVGHGVFNNPDETVDAALKVLKEELEGYDVTVFLHVRLGKPNVWLKGAEKSGVKWTAL